MPGEQAEYDLIRILDDQADAKQDTFFIAPKEIGRDGAGTQQLTLESVTEPDTPPAGEQYVFLDQSGALKAKAADGTVTTLGSGATFPDDAEYVTLSTDADLSAEKLHQNLSGAELHDPAAHAGTHTKGSTDALNVNNLVDADTKADLTQAGGVLVTSQIPAISITSIDVVADQTARLNLTAEEGDVAVQTDTGEAYILSTNDPTVDSNWVEITIDVLSQIVGQQITPAQVGTSSNRTDVVADTVDTNSLTGVDTGGIKTKTRVFLSTASSADPIPFDSVSYDPDGNFDTTANEYTVPATGTYQIALTARVANSVAAGSRAVFQVTNNGSIITEAEHTTEGNFSSSSVTDIRQLTSGDVIRVENFSQVKIVGGEPKTFLSIAQVE